MYHFELTNHGTHPSFLFENFCNLFLCMHNLYHRYLLFLGYRKSILQAMTFHWIFLKHPCIHMGQLRNNKINFLISWLENSYVLANLFFKFSPKFFWKFLLRHKHFYFIKSSLAFVYSRQQSQTLYFIQHVLHFLLTCPYLHLISWIFSARLSQDLITSLP